MLMHIDDGLLVIIKECLDTENLHTINKYDVEDALTDILADWCNHRITEGWCGEHAEEFMKEWENQRKL